MAQFNILRPLPLIVAAACWASTSIALGQGTEITPRQVSFVYDYIESNDACQPVVDSSVEFDALLNQEGQARIITIDSGDGEFEYGDRGFHWWDSNFAGVECYDYASDGASQTCVPDEDPSGECLCSWGRRQKVSAGDDECGALQRVSMQAGMISGCNGGDGEEGKVLLILSTMQSIQRHRQDACETEVTSTQAAPHAATYSYFFEVTGATELIIGSPSLSTSSSRESVPVAQLLEYQIFKREDCGIVGEELPLYEKRIEQGQQALPSGPSRSAMKRAPTVYLPQAGIYEIVFHHESQQQRIEPAETVLVSNWNQAIVLLSLPGAGECQADICVGDERKDSCGGDLEW